MRLLRWSGRIESYGQKAGISASRPLRNVSGWIVDCSFDSLLSVQRDFFRSRSGTKASTVLTWRNAERNLKEFFGADKRLRDITEDDAENFQRSLMANLAAATVRKRISIAKQMLTSARKARLIHSNPFSELKTGSLANKKRQYFVSHAETEKLLDACSTAEWRTLIALARYGALRIPSEIREMKWDDINWANDCIHVHATKTEHHEDDGERIVPMFPELRGELTVLWEHPESDSVYVLPNIRHTTNVIPTLVRIIKRAGLKVWPKPWQNMRASRATELENEFGAHKATQWCGHTEKIAEAHYWMVTDDAVSEAAAFVSVSHLSQKSGEEGGNGGQAELEESAFSLAGNSHPSSSTVLNRARGT